MPQSDHYVFPPFVPTRYSHALRRRRPGATGLIAAPDHRRSQTHTLPGDKAWPSLCDRVKAISYADGPEAEVLTSSSSLYLTRRGDKACPFDLRSPRAGWPDSTQTHLATVTAL